MKICLKSEQVCRWRLTRIHSIYYCTYYTVSTTTFMAYSPLDYDEPVEYKNHKNIEMKATTPFVVQNCSIKQVLVCYEKKNASTTL